MNDYKIKHIDKLEIGEIFRILVCPEKITERTKFRELGDIEKADVMPAYAKQSETIVTALVRYSDSEQCAPWKPPSELSKIPEIQSLDDFKKFMNSLGRSYQQKFIDRSYFDYVAVRKKLSKMAYFKDAFIGFTKGFLAGVTAIIGLMMIGYLIGHIFGHQESSHNWKAEFIDLEPLSKATALMGFVLGILFLIFLGHLFS
jgi:hypothetical protein